MIDKFFLSEFPFQSFQGEGRNQNRNVLFIRFSNCNMACEMCDTKNSWKDRLPYTMDQIKDIINGYYDKINGIVFTGGEPLLNRDVIGDIICEFPDLDYEIETNGSIQLDLHDFGPFRDRMLFNISPKFNIPQLYNKKYELHIFSLDFRKHFKYIFKFLFNGVKDLEFVEWFAKEHSINSNNIYVQPIGTDEDTLKDIISKNQNYILDNSWNLSMRTHIWLKVK